MTRYRKIDVRIWGDEKFKALSPPEPNGQDCFWHLMTSRYTSNIPGLFHAFEEALAREIGWTLEGYRKAFREVLEKGMVKADWSVGLIFLPNAIKYNAPQSPNVVTNWSSVWDELPECPLKIEAYHRLKAFIEGMHKAFLEAFLKAFGEGSSKEGSTPSGNQDQDQEQDQEEEKPPEQPPSPSPPTSTSTPRIGDIVGDAMDQHRKPDLRQDKNPTWGLEREDPSSYRSRIHPPAMLEDRRAGSLQPVLLVLQALYVETWGKDPAKVPILSGDNLMRCKEALTGDRAGYSAADRIEAAKAAIRGHKRTASREGSQLGKGWRSVYPVGTINGKPAKHRLDWDRYAEFVEEGQSSTRTDTESPAERERRQREAQVEAEQAEMTDEDRAAKAAEGRELMKRAAAEARKG